MPGAGADIREPEGPSHSEELYRLSPPGPPWHRLRLALHGNVEAAAARSGVPTRLESAEGRASVSPVSPRTVLGEPGCVAHTR